MDQSIAWQKAVQDLAGDNQEICEQLREITGWFPSIEMMRNHARGLIKVMREDEKLCAFPPGYCVPPSSVILWVMRELQRTTDPTQRARWWMYRSSRMTAPQPDPTRLASRTERVTDVVLALPAAVLDPEVQIIPPFFTGGNKKKKPVVGVMRSSERLKNFKNN
ncbi:hypothetical protein ZWY2020_026870 [Hordeum vulgare]|nr:hypothetical protein ZWY2020_026870 [Hordeum vulgare]